MDKILGYQGCNIWVSYNFIWYKTLYTSFVSIYFGQKDWRPKEIHKIVGSWLIFDIKRNMQRNVLLGIGLPFLLLGAQKKKISATKWDIPSHFWGGLYDSSSLHVRGLLHTSNLQTQLNFSWSEQELTLFFSLKKKNQEQEQLG